MTLPPFPVDDATLLAVEHALDTTLSYNEAGELVNVGSDYSMSQLLDLLSGVDPEKWKPAVNEYDTEIPDMVEYTGGPIYHTNDIIRALIDEVRRLRQ